ncbi:MAG: PTS glucose transporter subunit IIA [Clostridium sp.]|nr:PTS glucose transporter subunit IIA [Clostridium sp.]
MLNFLKKTYEIIAPISGRVIDLKDVPDKVFSQKMAGDGIAIEPTGDTLKAPADGTLSLVFKTSHAIGITLDNGIELLIHVGIDTVELNGSGFKMLIEEGSKVKRGQEILKIDRDFITKEGYSLVTMILISNMDKVKIIEENIGDYVEGGLDKVFNYEMN